MTSTREIEASKFKPNTHRHSRRRAKLVRRLIVCLAIGTFLNRFADDAVAATIVAPNVFASAEAPHVTFGAFRGENADLSFQWIFPASDFSAVPAGSPVTAIGFRINGISPSQGQSASFAQWNLQLSSSNNPSLTLSPTYDDNLGTDVVTVRSGPLTIPANAFPSGSSPNQFYDIPFMTPYVYNGGEVVVTLRHTAHSGPQDLIGNDADSVENGRGNSVSVRGFADADGVVAFGHFPVTRFTFVPEPACLPLLTIGLLVMVKCRRLR